ncbi:MAG TPA: GTP 3',8-cyclase MoaA [Solirubrobacterales bacterium]|nr:GTP 3',8-cyclase MoaA [Solirubrobacterales bacterium]
MTLEDAHGRLLGDLRVSVTDRCNFRCRYCMPAEGVPWIERSQILSFEEIERLVELLVGMGIRDVRLTGGEPLVRREFPALVARLGAIEGIRDLSLTTNGYLLAEQAEALVAAGIDRVNVSVDSLARARFIEVTRRDALDRVLAGLDAIAAFPEVRPIKVNAVPIPGFGEDDVRRFCALARDHDFQVRFIEFMPLDGERAWRAEDVLSGAEVRAMVEAIHPLRELPREPHATARIFEFADGGGAKLGFINPVSEPFCADCNRLRLTADGKLRTCLFSQHETDLREPLRGGASDEELAEIVRAAVWRKELKHRIDEPGFRPPARTMSAIGG